MGQKVTNGAKCPTLEAGMGRVDHKLTLLDTLTGKIEEITSSRGGFYWSEGGGSCDCNRSILFGEYDNIRSIQEIQFPELRGAASGYCFGSKRFWIVESDYADWTLDELNYRYGDIPGG